MSISNILEREGSWVLPHLPRRTDPTRCLHDKNKRREVNMTNESLRVASPRPECAKMTALLEQPLWSLGVGGAESPTSGRRCLLSHALHNTRVKHYLAEERDEGWLEGYLVQDECRNSAADGPLPPH